MAKRKAKPELNLWGEPFEDYQQSRSPAIGLDFEGQDVRMIYIRDEPWWVASDAGRGMAISNVSQSVRGQERTRPDGTIYWSGGLDDDEWCLHTVYTPSGPIEMLLVNESGIYALAFKSRTDEAKRFKRWLTHEVLPALRKTGTYSLTGSPATRIARRLKCDRITAVRRVENIDINKHSHGRLKSDKAKPIHYRGWHNGRYNGLYNLDAKGLRRELEIKGRRSPLDFMGLLAIVQNSHATALAERMIQEQNVPIDEQPALIERVSREIAESDAAKMGEHLILGIRDDPKRGKILDYVPRALNAPD